MTQGTVGEVSNRPWEKWTVADLTGLAETERLDGYTCAAECIRDMAELFKRLQAGELCVWPKELAEEEVFTSKGPNGWLASLHRDPVFERSGATQQAAIENLAALMREVNSGTSNVQAQDLLRRRRRR